MKQDKAFIFTNFFSEFKNLNNGSSHQRCSIKKRILKNFTIFAISQCSPVNIAKFLRYLFSKNLRTAASRTTCSCHEVLKWLKVWRQINVETTVFVNVESILSIITTILTLGNVETTLSFSRSSFTTLTNVETKLWIWPFVKSWKINLDFSAK